MKYWSCVGESLEASLVSCGARIQPGDEGTLENLARYIVCASFSQERMTYIRKESKVVYQSKDGKEEKVLML
jgi:hypothetical protein